MLTCESNVLADYLVETEDVNWSDPSIQKKASELFAESSGEEDFVKRTYEFVRDKISHSWDIQSPRITSSASQVLEFKEGICYAKSNLLGALLRSQGIPTGFCYQRLTLGDTPDTGHCIHALNAVYLSSAGRWVRLDARGNKAGIQAEYSVNEEKLAFPVREEYGEVDYPVIYASPHPDTMKVLKEHTDSREMYKHGLPSEL